VPALQQAEAVEKQIKAGAKSDGAPGDGANGIAGMKQQNKRNQNDSARWGDFSMSTRVSRLAEPARSWQQKRAEQAYVGNKAE
jgi:hypothetical protein